MYTLSAYAGLCTAYTLNVCMGKTINMHTEFWYSHLSVVVGIVVIAVIVVGTLQYLLLD